MARPWHTVVTETRHRLGMTQAEFGAAAGWSHRTAVRWDAKQSSPGAGAWTRLAKLVYPKDRDLALECAFFGGATLVSLGLEAPPAPADPEPSRARTRTATLGDLVDVVVLAGVSASGGGVKDVERWVHAVAKRAGEVGLTLADVEQALRARIES